MMVGILKTEAEATGRGEKGRSEPFSQAKRVPGGQPAIRVPAETEAALIRVDGGQGSVFRVRLSPGVLSVVLAAWARRARESQEGVPDPGLACFASRPEPRTLNSDFGTQPWRAQAWRRRKPRRAVRPRPAPSRATVEGSGMAWKRKLSIANVFTAELPSRTNELMFFCEL
jgi:hypothetical protein